MKKFYIYIIMVLIAIGCSKQDEAITNNNRIIGKSLNVKTEDISQSDTKAYIEDLKVVFEEGDELAVFDNNTAASKYIYSTETQNFSEQSVNTGTEISGVFAIYPYSENAKCDGSKIDATLPAKQTYEVNSFSNDSHIMFGVTDNVEDGITLKNMCGYIKLQLYAKENVDVIVKEIKLSTKEDGQLISGDFYISKDNDEEEYSLKMYEASQEHSAQSGSVILDCSAQQGGGVTLGNESEPTIFYIAVPAQTYSNGFQITVTDIYGRDITKGASASFTLERSHIKPMAALEIDMNSVITIETDENGNAYVTADANENIFPIEKFLKWGYLVNHCNYELGIKLTGNVNMPNKEIEADHVNKTYKITDTDITVTDGIPSGSNWVPLGNTTTFYGNTTIDGGGYTINGLKIKEANDYVGFVRVLKPNAKIINITFNNANIYGGTSHTGTVVGYSNDGTLIKNVHVKNSYIIGNSNVGGIVGRNYRRITTKYNEKLSYIINCSTDENTYVESKCQGTGNYPDPNNAGGICGYNYGAVIINCTNNADVKGTSRVGGIVGQTRTYNSGGVNGYVIASTSTDKATITAIHSDGYAGGITGMFFHNTTHTNSESYIVACSSLSTVNAKNAGSMVGDAYSTHHGLIYSSFADKKKLSSIAGINGSQLINSGLSASNHYESANEITEQIVNEMNSAINDYNNSVTDKQSDAIENLKCHYKWQYNAGGWPTLVESPASSNP